MDNEPNERIASFGSVEAGKPQFFHGKMDDGSE